MNAYVTLVSNQDYAIGALALTRSLALTGSAAPLLVLAPRPVDGLDALERAGARIVPIAALPFPDDFRARHARDPLHARAPFSKGDKPAFHDPLDNFLKLRLWQLEGVTRAVFLDADVLVVRNIDRLFDYPELCAAPNLYTTLTDMRRMNSGVFTARPDPRTFERMWAALIEPEAFWPRTDQTFLERFWPDWHGLPYTYNTLQYLFLNLPELWHWPSIRVVHYQYEKPWQAEHPRRAALRPLIELWWRVHDGKPPPADLPARA